MAKGLRSSKKKVNKLALRHRVFGPVEDARKERLSTKLLELASKPKARIAEEEQEEEDMKVVNSDQGWGKLFFVKDCSETKYY